MNTNKIKAILIVIVVNFIAVYLATTAVNAQLETILWILGTFVLVLCIGLGQRLYLLLPLAMSINFVLPLPGMFDSGILAQGLFIGFSIILFSMRKLPIHFKFSELEFWCILIALTIIQAYFRNPVGLLVFGTDSVGAKPYAVAVVAFLSAIILSLLKINPKDLKLWVRLVLVGTLINFGLSFIGLLLPGVARYLGATFSTDLSKVETSINGRASRIGFLRPVSYIVATWVSSLRNPLSALFSPIFGTLIFASLIAAAMSGYRSAVIQVGLLYFVGICYRGGASKVVTAIFGLTCGLVLLAVTNLVKPLPINIQRSLTFLPGTWDTSLKQESEGSSEWRIEMWKEALLTPNWIENKILGDGLGFNRREFLRMIDMKYEGSGNDRQTSSGLTRQQESFMISGGYHSGPVHTIRTTGYIGLIILLTGMIRVAVHAHRQILRTRGTEWYSVALFIGVPLIVLPIFWTFVFGTFNEGVSTLFIGAALVRLMEKRLPLPAFRLIKNTDTSLLKIRYHQRSEVKSLENYS